MASSSRLAPRAHIAEHVFEGLAAAILQGEFPAGSALPSERIIGERFGASRVVVRQAVHRLADIGLVRVRQGSATLVCELAEADLRVIELLYRFAPDLPATQPYLRDLVERDYLQAVMMLDIMHRRARPEARRELAQLAIEADFDPADPNAVAEFEYQFWSAVSRVGENRIMQMEFDWWRRTVDGRSPLEASQVSQPAVGGARLRSFYQQLGRLIEANEDPVGFYLAGIRPVLDQLLTPE